MARSAPFSCVHPTDRLVGNSPAIQALRAQIHHLAAFDSVGSAFVPTLLLEGETGTGKGLVARVTHDSGPRAEGPFIDVNCAAIPETLLEVELFGFEAGTFTDAKHAKPGLFESAAQGTLFLDEIDALPPPLQGKLLAVIEEKRVRRLGAVADRHMDVKLIAATSIDMGIRVTEGRFRPDLYHRLAVVILAIPPLRERGEDILPLAQHFLRQYGEGYGLPPKRLSGDAERWLQSFRWSGNVRELSHLMERVTLLSAADIVDAPTLERLSRPRPHLVVRSEAPPGRGADEPVGEAARIRQALSQTGGNVLRAAHLLGMSRGALRYRMGRYGIGRPPFHLSTFSVGEDAGGKVAAGFPSFPAFPQQERKGLEILREGEGGEAEVYERKLVAVLAIDLSWPEGIELNSPRSEPWTLSTRWQQSIAQKVQGFEGLILQHSPSPLIAVFGLPQTLEQMPQRATQVALAIRHQVAEDKAPDGTQPAPEVRMAVHLGHVLVDVRASDSTARLLPLGETLSLPVRLLGQAIPGDILLSPQVGRLVEGWFELHVQEGPAGARISDGVGAYAVVGLGPRRSPLEVYGKRPLSRFVGRERELALLCELLAQAEKGQGQVVGILGEPGVGKSRLCYELAQSQRTHGWLILESSPVAYGKSTPYLPVIDLLKTYFHIEARDEVRTIRDKVTDKLRMVDAGLGTTIPPLLALLDVPVEDPQWQELEPPQRRQRTLDALKRLLLQVSQAQPLLLIVENLHWIDTGTQDFLGSLIDSLPTARMLLVINYRPEYQHLWGSKTYYTQLRLDPLPPERSDELLHALLGEDASLTALRQLLIVRTEGNPFFLEESVRALVESQALLGEPRAYRLAQALPTILVPTTVQTVVAARIDRLPPENKRLLQAAAVIGKNVPFTLLQAIADLPEEALHSGLARLQATEFLYETRLFPEREFTFKHALTQEVAYGSLLHERRRAIHAQIVDALERLYADRMLEHVDQLAHHAFRGERWDKAVTFCQQAGAKALTRWAYCEAVGYFEQALRALPHVPETRETREQAVDLRLALRTALYPSGDWQRILALLREAEPLAAALDDPRRLGQVLVFLALQLRNRGMHDQAITAGQRARVLATASGDLVLEALANQYLGVAYRGQDDYRWAIDCLGQAVAFFAGRRRHERFDQLILPAVFSRANLALCQAELGLFAEGRALVEEGLQIAETAAHPGSLMFAASGVGQLAVLQGDLPRALPLLECAVALCQDMAPGAGRPANFVGNIAALGAAYTLDGRVAEAERLLTRALEQISATTGGPADRLCHLAMGKAQMVAGRLAEAHAHARRALALAREYQRGHQAYALRLLGEIAAQRDPPEVAPAEDYFRQALALAEALGMRPLQAHCHRGLGTLYTQVDRPEQAHVELSTAIALYRAMAMTFWLPGAEAALAQIGG